MRRNKTLLLLALALSPAFGEAPTFFGPEAFRKISFSPECKQKQWSVTPDGALTLILGPANGVACSVDLELHNPVNISETAAMSFDVRGSLPRQPYAIALAEPDSEDFVRTKRYRAADEWGSDGLRVNRIREGWQPTRVNVLRFIAFPNKHAEDGRTLYLRNLKLAGQVADDGTTDLPPAPEEPTVVEMDEPTVIPTLAAPPRIRQPERKSFWSSWHFPRWTWPTWSMPTLPDWQISWPSWTTPSPTTRGALLLLWAIPAWLLTRRRRRKRTGPLATYSPLYEMNTRTWRSRKDADGVVHVGGFARISTADLQEIKESGFNSIWFMGIWEVGQKVRAISRRYGDDFIGSPYAISDYSVSQELGTESEFRELVARAHAAGLAVFVDFVPNHMGLDSQWLNTHPEYFLHKVLPDHEAYLPDAELESRYPAHFPYRTPSYPMPDGRRAPKTIMVAYGRDPYFYPWIDTAQLDYAKPQVRRHMIDVLSRWAQVVDGIRCDMAMLVLREQVKVHRHPEMSQGEFDRLMPEEFWSEAIRSVKRVNPNFVFMAETYWAMEGYLQQLGFDYTYNKPLYEAICSAFHSGHAESLLNFLRVLGTDFLRKGVHFLENHDEERAMNALGYERQRGAATMIATLPGVALIHQGQMEGRRERLPVQRAVPLNDEELHEDLSTFYKRLMHITDARVFRDGRVQVLYSSNPAFITYGRMDDGVKALVVINSSGHLQKGVVSLMPGMGLKTGMNYRLHDLYYGLKSTEIRRQHGVQPTYTYPASQLINQGLYVELQPYDAHLFLFEARKVTAQAKLRHALRDLNTEWPLPRSARRLLGPALLRSSDRK